CHNDCGWSEPLPGARRPWCSFAVFPAKAPGLELRLRLTGANGLHEPSGKLLVGRFPADGDRLDGRGAGDALDAVGLDFSARSSGVADVSDHGVELAGPELVDEAIAGGQLYFDVLHDRLMRAALFQRLLGDDAERALLLVANADAQARLAQVFQRLDLLRV